MHLVRADGEKMAAKTAHIKLHLARALNRVDVEEDTRRRRNLADLWLLASITLISRVCGRIARMISVGSMRPLFCGFTNVVSTPWCFSLFAASRIAECSIDVVMK